MTEKIKAINELYEIKTTSGMDSAFKKYVEKQLKGCCDEIFSDDLGNVYVLKKGNGTENKKKIAITCAIDTFGFVVKFISENGKILLHATGIPNLSLVGKKCMTESGVFGVLLTENYSEKIGEDDFYMLVDTESFDISKILLGEFVSVENPPMVLGENKICLNDVGNKVFADSLIKIAKFAGDFSFDIYFVFTSQHLLASRGEKAAASRICPDVVISFGLCENEKMNIGDGAVITLADIGARCTPSICDKLFCASEKIGVSCRKNADIDKNSQSYIVPYSHEGSATAIIGAVCKKRSCGVYLCDIRDIKGAEAIVSAYLIFEDEN